MTDRHLAGNGRPCRDCPGLRCPDCRGSGRVALPDEEIVAAHVEEARRVYWPAWDEMVEKRA